MKRINDKEANNTIAAEWIDVLAIKLGNALKDWIKNVRKINSTLKETLFNECDGDNRTNAIIPRMLHHFKDSTFTLATNVGNVIQWKLQHIRNYLAKRWQQDSNRCQMWFKRIMEMKWFDLRHKLCKSKSNSVRFVLLVRSVLVARFSLRFSLLIATFFI